MRLAPVALLTATAALSASPVMAMPIIIDGFALRTTLDSITVDGSSSIDVNADQFLNGDDWEVSGSGGSIGTAIDTGTVPAIAAFASAQSISLLASPQVNGGPLIFGIYDWSDTARRVGLFSTGDPEGAQYLLQIMLDGSVRVNMETTGVDFAANRFGFYITDGVTTRFSDWHRNPNMGVHSVFYAGNGDVLQIGEFAPGRFAPGEWITAWEFGDLAEGTREFDDFVLLVESVNPLSVPEPGSLALMGLGLLGLFGVRAGNRPGSVA